MHVLPRVSLLVLLCVCLLVHVPPQESLIVVVVTCVYMSLCPKKGSSGIIFGCEGEVFSDVYFSGECGGEIYW